MLTDVSGVLVGHWTEAEAQTGTTVIVLPEGTTASGEVRGGAPATREFALLDPIRTVAEVDAVVLTGGSAFGLAAADGVMSWLESHERGFETSFGRVPIVVAMALFDLGVGAADVRPGAAEGLAAVTSAASGAFATGLVGAGTGATTGKWLGRDRAVAGGVGTASLMADELVVSALVAVNAVGVIDDGASVEDLGPPATGQVEGEDALDERTNTTIGVIVTNGVADKVTCHQLAQSGHDGLARALLPAHTPADGDALVAAATNEVEADPFHLRLLAQHAVTKAVRSLRATT